MPASWNRRHAPRGALRTKPAIFAVLVMLIGVPPPADAHERQDADMVHEAITPGSAAPNRPYDGLEGARAVWVYRRPLPARAGRPAQVRIRRSTTASTADGRFGNVEHQTIEGQKTPGDELATYFVFGEGRSLWCAYAEGSRYTETTLPSQRDILDPAPQFCLAPWARVGAWLNEFDRRGVVPNASSSGMRYEIEGAGRGGTFAIELGLHHELTAIEFGLGQSRLRWEYSDFHEIDGRPIPRRLRDYTITTHDGIDVVSGEGLATLESFEANTPDVADAVRFDPQKLNVRYFNEATGEVFSPDRSQKLFTIHEEGMSGGGLWSRRAWLMGVLAAVGTSLWLLWRKWRMDR